MRRLSILSAVVATFLAPALAQAKESPTVTIAVLPSGTAVAELGGVEGVSPGVLSAGLGDVPPAQTWLDITQGVRTNESLYDGELAPLRARGGRIAGWDRVLRRARSAPADILPGLLATKAGVAAVASGLGEAAVLGADRQGEGRAAASGVPEEALRNPTDRQARDDRAATRGDPPSVGR